jgi:hypothetical protein
VWLPVDVGPEVGIRINTFMLLLQCHHKALPARLGLSIEPRSSECSTASPIPSPPSRPSFHSLAEPRYLIVIQAVPWIHDAYDARLQSPASVPLAVAEQGSAQR